MTQGRVTDTEWQRVSPVAIIFFIVNGIPHLVNLWPALVPIIAGGETIRQFIWSYGLYLLGALVLLNCVLPYWFFRYKIAGDHIQLRSGILHRKRLTLYYDRVQQADIAQPFYFRPFGLAVLGLESAGSAQQEVHIPGLAIAQAEDLKTRILAFREENAAKPTTEAEPDAGVSKPDYELRLPWHEVARFGLMHNGLLLFFPVLGPLLQHWLPGFEDWLRSFEGTGLHHMLLSFGHDHMALLMIVFGTVSATLGLLSLYLLSSLVALVRYWDYHLTRHQDQYQSRAGLATVKTRGFRLHKLQLVTFSQGIVARLIKRCSVTISKAGGSGQHQDHTQQRFLVPVLSPAAWQQFRQQLHLPQAQWQRVSRFFIYSRTLLWAGFLSLSGAFLLWINDLAPAPAAGIFPLVALILWRCWRCLGFYYDAQWVALKTGFIGRKMQWLPIVKAQKIVISQPPWLRPMGLVNLHIWGADGMIRLPCVPRELGLSLRDFVLERVAAHRSHWM